MTLTTNASGSATIDLSATMTGWDYFAITAVFGVPKTAVVTNGSLAAFTFSVYSGTAAVASQTFDVRILVVGY